MQLRGTQHHDLWKPLNISPCVVSRALWWQGDLLPFCLYVSQFATLGSACFIVSSVYTLQGRAMTVGGASKAQKQLHGVTCLCFLVPTIALAKQPGKPDVCQWTTMDSTGWQGPSPVPALASAAVMLLL